LSIHDCLRALSADALVDATLRSALLPGGMFYNANASIVFWPVVGGDVFSAEPVRPSGETGRHPLSAGADISGSS
jgi:hypothetical protein